MDKNHIARVQGNGEAFLKTKEVGETQMERQKPQGLNVSDCKSRKAKVKFIKPEMDLMVVEAKYITIRLQK